jgi:glutamate-1-semialdehyde 2,1-aminomutase
MRQLDTERYAELFRHLLANGIYVAPSQYECLFPSLAHGGSEIEALVNVARGFFVDG